MLMVVRSEPEPTSWQLVGHRKVPSATYLLLQLLCCTSVHSVNRVKLIRYRRPSASDEGDSGYYSRREILATSALRGHWRGRPAPSRALKSRDHRLWSSGSSPG